MYQCTEAFCHCSWNSPEAQQKDKFVRFHTFGGKKWRKCGRLKNCAKKNVENKGEKNSPIRMTLRAARCCVYQYCLRLPYCHVAPWNTPQAWSSKFQAVMAYFAPGPSSIGTGQNETVRCLSSRSYRLERGFWVHAESWSLPSQITSRGINSFLSAHATPDPQQVGPNFGVRLLSLPT